MGRKQRHFRTEAKYYNDRKCRTDEILSIWLSLDDGWGQWTGHTRRILQLSISFEQSHEQRGVLANTSDSLEMHKILHFHSRVDLISRRGQNHDKHWNSKDNIIWLRRSMIVNFLQYIIIVNIPGFFNFVTEFPESYLLLLSASCIWFELLIYYAWMNE